MSNAQDRSKLVSDVVVIPLINFLISETAEYENLEAMVKAFNAALDALNEASYQHEIFGVFVDAVENKWHDLSAELFLREQAYFDAIFSPK